MKKILIIISLFTVVCGELPAQPKLNGASPVCEKRSYDQRIVIDTAHVRVLYALNAKDIKDEDTYIDLGKLEVGKRVKKYSSEFLNLSDQEVLKWKKAGKVECRKAIRWEAQKKSLTTGVNWYSPTTSSEAIS